MNDTFSSPRLAQLNPIADAIAAAAVLAEESARKIWKTHRRTKRGSTLRPSDLTPLWNELARAVELSLRRYGDKARLGRRLGLSRQQIHRLVVAKTASADAERTLLLLVWLNTSQKNPHVPIS